MDKAVKKDWTAALRSGKYKQGQGYLKDDGEYCCLGVLCEIHPDFDFPVSEWPTALDKSVLGFDDDIQRKLIEMNDLDSKTFNEIADWIDEHVPTT